MKLLKIYKKDKGGFSLVEIVLALTILVTFLGFGLLINFDSMSAYQFLREEELVLTLLKIARNRAMNNVNQIPHGLAIAEHHFMLFEGDNSLNFSRSQLFPRNPAIAIEGDAEIIFQNSSALPLHAAQFILTEGEQEITITVNPAGQIDNE